MNLLELTIQGGVLILAVLALRGLLRYRLPGWTFRILWGVALVRLLVPVSLPSQWSVFTGLDRLTEQAETVQAAPSAQVSLPSGEVLCVPPVSSPPTEPAPAPDRTETAGEAPPPGGPPSSAGRRRPTPPRRRLTPS